MPELGQVRTVSTGHVETLAGLPVIGGQALAPGDIVALNGQNVAASNGHYKVPADATEHTGAWTREGTMLATQADFDTMFGKQFVVRSGDYANSRWQALTLDPVTIGDSAIVFAMTSWAEEVGPMEGGGLERVQQTKLQLEDQTLLAQSGALFSELYLPGGRIQVNRKGITTNLESTYYRETFLDGLHMHRAGTQVIGVQPGACYIPGLDTIVEVPAEITATFPAAVSELVYVYITLAADGTPTLACYPQSDPLGVPSAPYLGRARTRLDAPAFRYLCAARVSNAGNLFFLNGVRGGKEHEVWSSESSTNVPVRLALAAPTATTWTTHTLGPTGDKFLPPSAIGVIARFSQLGTTRAQFHAPGDGVNEGAAGQYTLAVESGNDVVSFLAVDSAQAFRYKNFAAAGNIQVEVMGYIEVR